MSLPLLLSTVGCEQLLQSVSQVTAADVAAVVAAWTRIPVEQLSASDSARLQRLPDTLAVR